MSNHQNDTQTTENSAPVDENQIIWERRAKLTEIRKQGVAFPNDFKREHMAADLHAQYGEIDKEPLEAQAITVAVAG